MSIFFSLNYNLSTNHLSWLFYNEYLVLSYKRYVFCIVFSFIKPLKLGVFEDSDKNIESLIT